MNIQANPNEFAGKRVLVSGGTKGLGRATVERFLAGQARVITAARTIKDPVEGVEYVQADLTTAEGGEALSKAARERLGGVDILAHVVGGSASPAGGFAALTDDHWASRTEPQPAGGRPARPPPDPADARAGQRHSGAHHLDPVGTAAA